MIEKHSPMRCNSREGIDCVRFTLLGSTLPSEEDLLLKSRKIPLAKASRPVTSFFLLPPCPSSEQTPGTYMVRHVRYPHRKMGGWSQMTCPNGPTRMRN
jgi:hypothetical protein